MIRYCEKCRGRLSNRSKRQLCQECLSVCHCTRPKNFRATECKTCAMSRKAKRQWQDMRPKMLATIRAANLIQRTRYEDIGPDTNWQRKIDRRHWTRYWRNGDLHTVYRYQWVWEQANGPIPQGYVIHHKDGDCANDRLDNLDMQERLAHAKYHGAKNRVQHPEWVCQYCGKTFYRRMRKERPNTFCSLECYHSAQRSTTWQ